MAKVLMALSGGIDSAVSLGLLLKAGHTVEAAFMKNWSSTKGLKYDECPWLTDRQDALRVAAHFDVPLHTIDFEQQYESAVLDYFFTEYNAGRTPNPDVMCNKEIKFKLLYNWAMERGFDYLATGHYAQAVKVGKGKAAQYALGQSADTFKDQTYFIYNIKTEQLPHLLFPVGGYKKPAIKALAKKWQLPNADKKESMGLCFVGKIRLKDFLEQKVTVRPGPIVSVRGEKLGEHHGLAYYTIGQRQGIGIGGPGGPWFVVKKDLKTNTLTVTDDPNDKLLETLSVELHSMNWITEPISFPVKVKGRYRHQGELVSVTITKLGEDHFQATFSKPQKAVASGQSLVLYDKTTCLGGGVII
jgi:tRNA-specific 2-thiouridylase